MSLWTTDEKWVIFVLNDFERIMKIDRRFNLAKTISLSTYFTITLTWKNLKNVLGEKVIFIYDISPEK